MRLTSVDLPTLGRPTTASTGIGPGRARRVPARCVVRRDVMDRVCALWCTRWSGLPPRRRFASSWRGHRVEPHRRNEHCIHSRAPFRHRIHRATVRTCPKTRHRGRPAAPASRSLRRWTRERASSTIQRDDLVERQLGRVDQRPRRRRPSAARSSGRSRRRRGGRASASTASTSRVWSAAISAERGAGASRRVGGQVDLERSIRRHHGADVATLDHDAAGPDDRALLVDQQLAHPRHRTDRAHRVVRLVRTDLARHVAPAQRDRRQLGIGAGPDLRRSRPVPPPPRRPARRSRRAASARSSPGTSRPVSR